MKENKVLKIRKGLMKAMTKFGAIALAIGIFTACENSKATSGDDSINNFKDSVSYSIGVQMGSSLKRDMVEPNEAVLIRGIKDALESDSAGYDQAVVEDLFKRFGEEMKVKQEQEMEKMKTENLEKGQKFLEENAKKDGIMVTESGLQYKVITEGTGASPDSNDRVKVHYTGKLIDGKVFDSSIERGEPVEFAANRVIPGWKEGLQLMKTGAKYMFYIPAEIGYGEMGAGQDIGPNETLIFEVELLEVFPQ
ncbi:MAG: FKBP-type peptidyl-prolyl cis-trans isomerase [Candidatus Kapaibacteriales bacterium]